MALLFECAGLPGCAAAVLAGAWINKRRMHAKCSSRASVSRSTRTCGYPAGWPAPERGLSRSVRPCLPFVATIDAERCGALNRAALGLLCSGYSPIRNAERTRSADYRYPDSDIKQACRLVGRAIVRPVRFAGDSERAAARSLPLSIRFAGTTRFIGIGASTPALVRRHLRCTAWAQARRASLRCAAASAHITRIRTCWKRSTSATRFILNSRTFACSLDVAKPSHGLASFGGTHPACRAVASRVDSIVARQWESAQSDVDFDAFPGDCLLSHDPHLISHPIGNRGCRRRNFDCKGSATAHLRASRRSARTRSSNRAPFPSSPSHRAAKTTRALIPAQSFRYTKVLERTSRAARALFAPVSAELAELAELAGSSADSAASIMRVARARRDNRANTRSRSGQLTERQGCKAWDVPPCRIRVGRFAPGSSGQKF
ncbi:hypothetical protein [Burkholderia sp. MSMB1498]|uniref:hypothetical protein n=1 Tax=Burkholderia sp. MSMB1498 TaxID=1637842 RepID=UPI0012E3A42F|nr:hypothetical protein [Burkholderia sp. MSMB1498]